MSIPTEPESTVTISRALHDSLMKDSDLLACLEAAGVDNWDGWGEALRMHGFDPDDGSDS